MDEKMAELISKQRKNLNMTQKQLAEKIGVTDKAVSKWERGAGYPDISTIPALSKALNITAGELLGSEEHVEPTKESERIIEKTLDYANLSTKFNSIMTRNRIRNIIVFLSFLSIAVCTICNLAIQGRFTWSLYPIVSIIYVAAIITPLFQFPRKGIIISLCIISILTIPFLYILGILSNSEESMNFIGTGTAIVGIIYLWIIYFLFTKMKHKKNAAGITALLAIVVMWSVNYIVDTYTGYSGLDLWDYISYAIFVLTAIFFFFIGSSKKEQ